MTDVDTSSYPKAALPVGPLDIADKLGGLQSQALNINQQKLDQTNQALTYMTRAMGSLGPEATKQQYASVAQNVVEMGLVPQNMLNVYMERLTNSPSSKDFYNEFMTAAASHKEAIDWHVGQLQNTETGQRQDQTRTPLKPGAQPSFVRSIPTEPGPSTEVLDSDPNSPTFNQKRMLGNQPPPPAQGFTNSLPVGPIQNPAIRGQSKNFGGNVIGAEVVPNKLPVAGPTGPVVGTPPLFDEGKKQLVEDQQVALDRSNAIKPALQAYKLLKDIRSGPGTAQWNTALAFAKANNILDIGNENDPTAVYQEVNKKLSQYVQGAGTRSDADLASREASSPSAKTQIKPALIKLTRDAIALDRIKIAMPTAFEGKDYSKVGNHRATFPQKIDERAFTLDMLDLEKPGERQKLIDDMKKKQNTPEGKKFWKSLEIADKAGLY